MADAFIPNLSEFEGAVGVNPHMAGASSGTFMTYQDDKSYPWMYYRKPDGWIVCGQGWGEEIGNNTDVGWIPLNKYRKFPSVDPQGRYNISRDPYYVILHMTGGAAEFPLDQILEHRWHQKLPYPGVVFPQLDGVEIPNFKCTQCQKDYLSIKDLTRHESIAHKDLAQNEQLARNLSSSMAQVLASSKSDSNESSNTIANALMMLAQAVDMQGKILAALTEQRTNPVAQLVDEKVIEARERLAGKARA